MFPYTIICSRQSALSNLKTRMSTVLEQNSSVMLRKVCTAATTLQTSTSELAPAPVASGSSGETYTKPQIPVPISPQYWLQKV